MTDSVERLLLKLKENGFDKSAAHLEKMMGDWKKEGIDKCENVGIKTSKTCKELGMDGGDFSLVFSSYDKSFQRKVPFHIDENDTVEKVLEKIRDAMIDAILFANY